MLINIYHTKMINKYKNATRSLIFTSIFLIASSTIILAPALNPNISHVKANGAICKGDFNNNQLVDIQDFGTLGQNYKKSNINCSLDIIKDDCYLDVADFQEFAKVYKKTDYCVTTPPPVTPTTGIWLSPQEIKALPIAGNTGCTSGSLCYSAWNNIVSTANSSWGSANLSDNNSSHDIKTLGGALVAVRLDDTNMRNKTIQGLQSAMNSPLARSLELSRGLQTYIISADIIGYRTPEFETWVRNMLNADVSPHTGGSDLCNSSGVAESCNSLGGLVCTALRAPNNWGGHARASAIAAALYLKDDALLQRLVNAHRSFIGETVTNNLYCQSTNWHADSTNRYGINKVGSKINGVDVSGVLPEDWRRGAEFAWPPTKSGYMWEGMQGYVVASIMLSRAGKLSINSGDNALKRTMDILYQINYAPEGDDSWIPWVVNKAIGTNYPVAAASGGKNMAWTDWTHFK